MTTYTISDLHLDHGNIIEYCDRPFDTVDEMNETLVSNWNSIIDDGDTVLYLGDLAVWSTENMLEWAEKLNGDIILVIGNHDPIEDPEEMPFTAVQQTTVSHNGLEFYCEHYPVDVPEGADWWQLYGHHHNNDIDTYPFLDSEKQRINVSAELLDYTPVSLDDIVDLIATGQSYTHCPSTIPR